MSLTLKEAKEIKKGDKLRVVNSFDFPHYVGEEGIVITTLDTDQEIQIKLDNGDYYYFFYEELEKLENAGVDKSLIENKKKEVELLNFSGSVERVSNGVIISINSNDKVTKAVSTHTQNYTDTLFKLLNNVLSKEGLSFSESDKVIELPIKEDECEYCHTSQPTHLANLNLYLGGEIDVLIDNAELQFHIMQNSADGEVTVKDLRIKYCPMCGRKL